MRKYAVLAASILMQVCLGGVYAWSTFVTPLTANYGLSTTQTQLIFGITFSVFTMFMVYAGRLQDRRGPRLVAAIGGLLLGTGYLVSSYSGGSFPLLLLGYGLIGGAGIGFTYVCPLATCVKWFPEHKGLITGIVVAGYGGGAILLSNLAGVLFRQGMDVLQVFRLVGFTYGSAVIACAMLLSVPQKLCVRELDKRIPVRELLMQRSFQVLVVGMFTGAFAGMMIAGNVKPIGLAAGVSTAIATLAISTFAMGNAAGRISWGWISDRIGRTTIPISLAFLAVAVALLIPAGKSGSTYAIASAIAAFGFGGCMVIYAAQVAATYGTDAVGSIYPIIMLFYGASSLAGPAVGGLLFDFTGSYTISILVAASVTATGVIGTLILSRGGQETPEIHPEHVIAAAPVE